MKSVLNFSEADMLAFHCMEVLAQKNGSATNKEIAGILHASENHLSKVLQRLNHAGLIKSIRGPNGGFILAFKAEEISLMKIYEAVEGKFSYAPCLMGLESCPFGNCIFDGFYKEMNEQFIEFFNNKFLK